MAAKPYSQACDNNKQAIFGVLSNYFDDVQNVLEIGSGTGQHICHFAARLPHVRWQPSDLADRLPGICQWIGESDCTNILTPVVRG